MNNLARSVNARYLELLGKEVTFPEDGYHGQDIIDTAQRIIDRDGDKYLALSEEERLAIFKDLAYHEKLAILKEDLERFHVTFDIGSVSARSIRTPCAKSSRFSRRRRYLREGGRALA